MFQGNDARCLPAILVKFAGWRIFAPIYNLSIMKFLISEHACWHFCWCWSVYFHLARWHLLKRIRKIGFWLNCFQRQISIRKMTVQCKFKMVAYNNICGKYRNLKRGWCWPHLQLRIVFFFSLYNKYVYALHCRNMCSNTFKNCRFKHHYGFV